MSLGLSSHGTLIAIEKSPVVAGVFTTVGELGSDITPPALLRPSTEITPHNDDLDAYVVGVGRRGEMTFGVNFLPNTDGTHDHQTGLIKLWADATLFGARLTYTDGMIWIMSGFCTNVAPKAPVREGALTADVTIRPTGPMKIGLIIFS